MLAKLLRWLGAWLCGFPLLLAGGLLLTGVTQMAGEGQVMPRDTPEDVAARVKPCSCLLKH